METKDDLLARLEQARQALKEEQNQHSRNFQPLYDKVQSLECELDITYGPQLLGKYFQLGITSQYVYVMKIDKSERSWRFVCVNLQTAYRDRVQLEITKEWAESFLKYWKEIPESEFRALLEKEVRKLFGGKLPWE